MKKRAAACVLAGIMMLSTATTAVYAEEANGYDEKVSFSVVFFGADNTWKEDAVAQYLQEKFNFEVDFQPISWDNWGEQQRIWINSGDMPDVLFWDFNYAEYIEYADQEQIKALPEGWQEKYPNLAATAEKSGILDALAEATDGISYGIPRTSISTVESSQNADFYHIVYRKDWAEKCGIEVGETITVDELLALAEAYVTQDPGENGENNTIGITGTGGNIMTPCFLDTYNSYWSSYGKDENGKYYAGILEDSTLEGVKVYWNAYNDGLLDPNFFSNSDQDGIDNFNAGKAGIRREGLNPSQLQDVYNNFALVNPELDPKEAIGITTLVGPDGKAHGYESVNYWTMAVMNPDMDDATLDRILTVMDYLCTDEGMMVANVGLEGVDWEYDENGNAALIEKEEESGYLSTAYWAYMAQCGDGFAYINPAIDEEIRETCLYLPTVKENAGVNLKEVDLFLNFWTGPLYTEFGVDYGAMVTETVLEAKSEEDVETIWTSKVAEIEDRVNALVDELNEGAAANE